MSAIATEQTKQPTPESESAIEKKGPSFVDRLKACKNAFLSCPRALQSPEIISAVRRLFPAVSIRTFEKFANQPDCRQHISDCIAESDLLIIVASEDRVIPRGVFSELSVARTHRKLIIVFDIATNRWQRYWGYDVIQRGERKARVLRTEPAEREGR
ncbi:MAG: hypothetical protein MOB07_09580 [Acidobacteria bacterium]|nr:hypothetical protein [Acidobacteriota bacterium]